MQSQRQPLATQNGLSRLPMPSKLKTPSTKVPQSIKRTRSPGENVEQDQKRRCLDLSTSSNGSDASICSQQLDTSMRTRSNSSSNLKTTGSNGGNKTLKPSSSTGSLKTIQNKSSVQAKPKPVGRNIPPQNVSRKPVTAVVKPTAKPVVNKPPIVQTRSTSNTTANKTSNQVNSTVPKAPGGKKRPAWDLKGRLEDMEALLSNQNSQRQNLMFQLEDYNSRIATLETTNNHLSGTVIQKEKLATDASRQIDDLRQRLREEEDNRETMKRNLQREISDIQFLKDTLQRQKETLEGEINAARTEINGLKSSVAHLTSSQAATSAELDATKLQLDQALAEIRQKNIEISNYKDTIHSQEQTIEDFNCKFREHESMRRKLHNTIQELKGNIRVFCRVRPLLGDELLGSDGTIHHMNFPDDDQKILELEKIGDVMLNESCLTASKRGNKYEFAFDRVFRPDSTQSIVFEEISQLVQSALDGYNVCIFAYGQTGSGKTHTMEGSSVDDPEMKGMIPRAVLQIFETVEELKQKGWQYQFEASFLEIYNETIRDLLGNGKDDQKHEIKLTGNGSNDVVVTNLTLVPITADDQVLNLLKKASQNRAVAETKCNEHSSRSHSVFRLKITGQNDITKEACQGTLNLVDLAGSERLKDSGSEGQRLKETQSINKSLSNLGNVIMALGNKDSHVPYRNSKLTYLLQNSLGGNSKTLMFVNVSPKEECFQETLNSLRFATKVNQCNIGTAQKRTK